MNMVRCPRCTTEHRLAPGTTGYTCAGCGTAWRFVQCSECGSVFHAAAGTEAWTCKRCGRRNVAPLEATSAPGGGRPRARREPTGWSRLSPRARLVTLAVSVVVVAGVLVAVLLLSGGGKGGTHGPSNPRLALARRTYCHDLSVLQVGFRPDALQRFLTKVQRDVVLYRKAHDRASVKSLTQIQKAAATLKTALQQNSSNVQPANGQLEKAISVGPTC